VTPLYFFARWRVRLGYVLAVVVLWLARPTPRSMLIGAALGFVGLCIRGHAAGYLNKQEVLTVTGPYARTRNPLYFGSSMLMLGAAAAMHSVWAAALLFVYFVLVYSLVMRREEMELRQKHGDAFSAYAAAVPLFFPKLFVAAGTAATGVGFSWAQYKKNHEYEATVGFVLLLLGLILICWLRSR
jgi:protein-S-isoprenylcysteine O-methyltransferase Ste14